MMKRHINQSFLAILLALSLSLMGQSAVAANVLDQNCVVNILNRTIQVNSDGSWSMPNVPSTQGQVRARATCTKLGETFSGSSDYFTVVQNGIAPVPEIKFGNIDPIPVSMAITKPTVTTITHVGGTAQLQVMATYPDNTVLDVTAASNGINYTSSNPAVATVNSSGLVTSLASGTVLVTARKDEVAAFILFTIATTGDSDGDGVPDDYELANKMNPHDPLDAQEDFDSDGLTNLQEYKIGTNPNNPDTDGDGINDGDEVNGTFSANPHHYKTDPLKADSDGDGVSDFDEEESGYDPTNASDGGGRIFASIKVTPPNPTMTYNTMYNEANLQLKVIGTRLDGTTADITKSSTGTTYSSSDLSVVSFGGVDGLIFAGQSGTAKLTVKNHGQSITATVNVGSFSPVALSYIGIPGYANNVDISGDYAYVAAGSAGLQVVNVSDHSHPAIVGSIDTAGTALDVRVVGTVAYVADGTDGLQIFDVTKPSSPVLIASYPTAGFTQDVKVDNQYAYLANGTGGVQIVDVHVPSRPLSLGSLTELGEVFGVDAQGTTMVAVAGQSFYVIDTTDKLNPVTQGSISIGSVKDVAINGQYAYVAAYTSGYRLIDISVPTSPNIIGEDASFYPNDVELTDSFAFFSEVRFVNAAPYVNIDNPAVSSYQGYVDFKQFNDNNGTGLALDSNYVYLTDSADIADWGTTGSTNLMIGQYRLIEDNGGVPPTIQFTSLPQDSVAVEGKTINLLVDATDDIGVKSVTFSINGNVVYVDSSRPYAYPLYVPYGTVGNTITVSVTATDFGGNATPTPTLNLLVEHDTDRDGLSDIQEKARGTKPTVADTDGDLLLDGDEVDRGTNPLNVDTDGDQLTDGSEVQNETDPLNPDTTPPTVASTTPVNLATNVPENNPIIITFDEPLTPKFVKSGTVTVYEGLLEGAATIPGSVTWSSDGLQVIFTPTSILGHNTDYKIVIDKVRDLAGNRLVAPYTFQYKTGYTVDNTAPTVLRVDPAANTTDVPVNTEIGVVFSKPVDSKTVTSQTVLLHDSTTGENIQGIINLSGDAQSLYFIPNTALAVGRQYYISVTNGIKDLFGNSLGYSNFYFTTNFQSDSTGPQIVGYSLASGQSNVPTNPQLQVQFNKVVSDLSLGSITLTQSGAGVTIVRQLSSDHKTLTLKLLQPLLANSSYKLHIEGVQDLSGNLLPNSADLNFSTGSTADQVNPSLVNYSPAYNAGNVGLNSKMVMTFSDRLNPLSVNGDTVALYDQAIGQRIPATTALSSDGLTVTVTPSSSLLPNHQYYIYISNWAPLYSQSGYQVYGTSWYFQTGTVSNVLPPVISGSNLQDGAIGVSLNEKLRFVLDTQVTSASVANGITLQINGVTVPGTATLGSDNETITFTPTTALTANTNYTVVISGLTDYAGNKLAPVTEKFTTGTSTDTSAPSFYVTPSSNAFGISVNTPIIVTFNKAIDPTTLGGIYLTTNGYSGQIAGSASLSSDGKTVTFTPAGPLPANTQIYVNVYGVLDLTGNAANSYGYFSTGANTDTTKPTLLSITPTDGSVDVASNNPIVLTFSKSLNRSTVNNQSLGLFVNGGIVRPNISYSADNRTIILSNNIPASSTVSVVMTHDIQDMNGNALADTIKVFTTAATTDYSRPSIITVYPGNSSYQVPVKNKVVLYSNKPLKASTVQGALHISQNGVLITGTTQVLGDGSAIEFTPKQPWSKQALVEVFLDSTATDLNGDALYSYHSSFRTVDDPALTAPTVVAINTNNDIALPLNGVIDLQFNEPLDPATVNSNTFVLHDSNNSSSPLPVTVSLLKGNMLVRLTPDSALQAGHYYYFGVLTGVKNASEVASTYNSAYYWAFTAGQAVDAMTPQVLSLNPRDGASNVGINNHVDISFNEAINPLSMLPDNADIPLAQDTGGDARTYSLNFSNGNTQVSYVPHEPWAAASTVTLTVATPQDYAGQTVQSVTHTFTTANGPDYSTPTVSNWGFVNNATNIPVNAVFNVKISTPVDPISVNASTFYLYDSVTGQHMAASIAASSDGYTLSLVPNQALSVYRTYYLYVYGVQGVNGNALYQSQTLTTGTVTDTVAPQVSNYSFNDSQTGVATNVQLQVQFNEAVNGLSLSGVQLLQNGVVVPTTPQQNGDHTIVSLLLNKPLLANTAYTLQVQGVQDMSGNVLASTAKRSFTSGSGVDLYNASVVTYSPAYNAGNVGLNSQMVITFNDRLNPLNVNGDTVALYDPTTNQRISATTSLSSDGLTVKVTPSSSLLPNHQYYIYISNWATLYNQSGIYVNGTSWYFQTGTVANVLPPVISGSNIQNGATGVSLNEKLRFVLDTQVTSASVANGITLQINGVTVPGTATLGSDNETITFTPTTALTANTNYTVVISGLTDYAGNKLAPVTEKFTTGTSTDTSAPSFYVTPSSNAFGISVNTPIIVTFNKAMDPTTLGGIYLTASGYNGQIGGSTSLSSDGKTVTFTPAQPLPANTQIYVNVYGVLDLTGNAANSYGYFSTGANTDITKPTLLSITPTDGSVDVASNNPIVLTFSKSLNHNTVNNQSLGLFVNGGIVRPNISYSADNRTIILSNNIPASSTVSVVMTHDIQDMNGNALADTIKVFTTAATTDYSRPSIITVYPGNSSYQVPVKNKVVLYSNKPLKASTVQGALHVSQNGVLITGTTQVLGDGSAIEFTPKQPWSKQALVEVFLDSTATDLNGDALNSYHSSFRTVDDPALTAPTVVAINTNNGIALPLNGVIDLQFNEPLDSTTVNSNTFVLYDSNNSSSPIPVTVSLLKGNMLVRLTPNSALQAGHYYYYGVFTGVKNASGVASTYNSAYYWAFTAGQAVDAMTPQVLSLNPRDGASNVGINNHVDISFNEAINPLSMLPDNADIPLAQDTGGDARTYSLNFSNGNTQVSYVPHEPWAAASTVTLTVSTPQDYAGQTVQSVTHTFKTANGPDYSTPTVSNWGFVNNVTNVPVNAIFNVKISTPVDPISVTASTFYLYDNVTGQHLAASIAVSSDGYTLSLVPTQALTASRTYYLYVYGVQGINGNALYQSQTLTTGTVTDTVAPQVSNYSFNDSQTGVATNVQLQVQFNEAVNGLSLSGVQLLQNGVVVPTTPQQNGDHTIVSLLLNQPLKVNTVYTLQVQGVQDMSGNVLASTAKRSFTTGSSVDLYNASLVAYSPAYNATNIGINSQMVMTFNDRLNPLAVNGDTIALYDTATNQRVAASRTLSADGKTVTLIPAASLVANRTYYVYIGNWATLYNQSGNYVNGNSWYFTTGAAASQVTPSISSSNIQDGASGVVVNGTFTFKLNEPISNPSVAASILLQANGVTVPGTASLGSDNETITFTPAVVLAANTNYTLLISGLTDYVGNALTAVTEHFTTGAAIPANISPTFYVTPGWNSFGININSPILVTFNKPIDPTTLTGIYLTANGYSGNIAGSAKLSADGLTATITPAAPLPANAQVYVNVYGVHDLAGNNINSYSYFTTGVNTDTTAPQLLAITPTDGSVDIVDNAPIVLTFSKSLNQSTVNSQSLALYANGNIYHPSISYSADNRTVTLNTAMPASSVVSVLLTHDIQDLNGNALADTVKVFTTAVASNNNRPSIITAYPGNGASGVLTNNKIVLFSNKPLDQNTVSSALQVTQNSVVVPGTTQVLGDGSTIEFTPTKVWNKQSLIQVTLSSSATDLNGDALYTFTSSFRTIDDPALTAPYAVAINTNNGVNLPINGVIDVQFNEPLDPSTVSNSIFVLNDVTSSPNQQVPVTVTTLKGNMVVRMKPTANLQPGHTYNYGVLSGLKDASGVASTYNYAYYWGFTAAQTADSIVPQVTALSPINSASNVGINAHVDIRFNEAIDPISMLPDNADTPLAQDPSGNDARNYSLNFSNGNTQVSYIPHEPWAANTTVKLTVSNPEDYAGQTVQTISHTFYTANGPDFSQPVVSKWSFAADGTNVPVNTLFKVQMNKAIDPVSVSSASFYLHDTVLNQHVAATIAVSTDGSTLTLVPNQALAVDRKYYLQLYGVLDLNGNSTGTPYQYLTTGTVADTLPPQISGYSLSNGQINVPTNAQIQVKFNKPLSGLTLDGVLLLQNGALVATTPQLSADHTVLSLLLAEPLHANTSYTLQVSGVQDTSGNTLAATVNRSFTTGSGVDLRNASLLNYSPANNAVNVGVNSQMVMTFNDRLNPLTINNDTIAIYDPNTQQRIAAASSLSSDGKTVTLTPATPLNANYRYYVYISNWAYLYDLAGNSVPASNWYFQTSFVSNLLPPVISGSNIQDGASGLALNTRLRFVLDEPVTNASVNGSVILQLNGVTVAGTASLGSDNQTITYIPTSQLVANGNYTLVVSGLIDYAGNSLATVTEHFSTGNSTDTTSPTFFVTPGWNAFGISVNNPLTITFNKVIDPTTLGGIYLTASGYSGNIAGNASLSSDGKTVTFTPLSPLPGNTQIYVNVYGVLDLIGNTVNSYSYFTTGASTDNTPPKLLSITPTDGSADVADNSLIVLTFSKSLNQSTVNNQSVALFANGAIQRPNISYSADNRTVTLSNNGLPASSIVSVVLTHDIKDLNGNPLTDMVKVFTTAAANDYSRPSIAFAYPSNSASEVPTKNKIVLYSNKPLKTASAKNALHVSQNGVLVTGSTQVLGDGSTIEFTPAQPWSKQALVEVFMDSTATDMNGDALNSFYSTFRTVDDPALTAPTVIAINTNNGINLPLNGVIDLQFSEPLDPATVSSSTFVLYDTSNAYAQVPVTVSALKGNLVVRMTPNSLLQAGHVYNYGILSGVKDASEVAATYNNGTIWGFTAAQTADGITPQVLALSPTDGLTNVGINSRVDMRFNEAIDPISMLPENADIPLAQVTSGNDARTYSLSFSNGNTQVSYLPNEPWPANSAVTLTVANAQDYAGQTVQSLSHTFHTMNGPDFSQPSVSKWSFTANASNVPVNTTFQVQTSKPIDPVTVSAGTFYLHDNATNQNVPASVTVSGDNRTLTLVPTQSLAASRQYYLQLYGIYDLSGNSIGSPYQYFTTGAASDTTAPQITAYNFSQGQSGVPTNIQLQVQFSKALNGLSLSGVRVLQNGIVVPTTSQLSADRTLLSVSLTTPLQANTGYTLQVAGVQDTVGNVLASTASRSFTTGGGATIAYDNLVSYSPLNNSSGVSLNSSIVMTFNNLLNPLSINGGGVWLRDNSNYQLIPVTNSFSADGKTLTLTPVSALTANRNYEVIVNNYNYAYLFTDLAGNQAVNTYWNFTTGAN
ncbi:Ig-like domain-containing protein [Methylomonas sp. AM2-LC]|uniref:Ig-like domain-containing protein n=1 Tax=Methylomonas sp. AM2-LC TaxID=3153301 RepID=UPI00326445A2